MLGRAVAERLAAGRAQDVWSPELREVCSGCDALVLNLECCISARGAPTPLIPDKPFFFRSPPSGVEALKAVGASVASLANNHALDFGPEALTDTLEQLDTAGIAATGAGLDVKTARRGALIHAGGLTLGVLALSDHPEEFAADEGAPGIAYADLPRGLPGWALEQLARLREAADLLVAFPHWGPNMTIRPDNRQRRLARELIAAGADAVAGHSAHVFHGVELLPGGPVLYDLGDVLDDYAVDRELRNDLGILALWRPRGRPLLELVGLRLDFCVTRLAQGDDADWIADRLARACEELGTEVERIGEARFAIA
jgi:poly-gamma-glutamate capsule biosynthesis protein CapA/YwtB (metallophosphatase superfamily)